MPNKLSKEKYFELIQSCADNCTSSYCFFKTFLESQHPNEKTLIQLKVMEIMKWIWSAEAGFDIGWNNTGLRWADEGYAENFSEIYDPELGIRGNFLKLVERMKSLKSMGNVVAITTETK